MMNAAKTFLKRHRVYIRIAGDLSILILISLIIPYPFPVGMSDRLLTLYRFYVFCVDIAVVLCIARASLPDYRWVNIGFIASILGMTLSLVMAIAQRANTAADFWVNISEPLRQGLRLLLVWIGVSS